MAAAITFLSTLMWLFLPLDGEVWTDTARSGYCQLRCVYSFIISLFFCPSYPTLFCIRHECALSVVAEFCCPQGGKKTKQGGKPKQNWINISSGVKAIMKQKNIPCKEEQPVAIWQPGLLGNCYCVRRNIILKKSEWKGDLKKKRPQKHTRQQLFGEMINTVSAFFSLRNLHFFPVLVEDSVEETGNFHQI